MTQETIKIPVHCHISKTLGLLIYEDGSVEIYDKNDNSICLTEDDLLELSENFLNYYNKKEENEKLND